MAEWKEDRLGWALIPDKGRTATASPCFGSHLFLDRGDNYHCAPNAAWPGSANSAGQSRAGEGVPTEQSTEKWGTGLGRSLESAAPSFGRLADWDGDCALGGARLTPITRKQRIGGRHHEQRQQRAEGHAADDDPSDS